MPVTIRPSPHNAREWTGSYAATATDLLRHSAPREYGRCKGIIQSSFQDIGNASVFPSTNGFVRAAYAAYSSHHHLNIRPEDIWFSILTQLSFYILANAEELRYFFVAHEGRKEVEVVEAGTISSVDFGALAVRMTAMMEKYIVQENLREWIMPDFTTTTSADTVTAAVLMMGAMQKYFSYRMTLTCGIPSVTLLGEKEDWEKIRKRLDFPPQLGKEAETFASLLVPVVDNFIHSFEAPESETVTSFWSKIAHHEDMGSGPTYLSGWITAFCFWNADGKSLYRLESNGCEISGVKFHKVDTDEIPEGFVSVPVTVDDNGILYKTRMAAGSVGIKVSSSGQMLDMSRTREPSEGRAGLDTLQPVSGWWMYELTADDEEEDPDDEECTVDVDTSTEDGLNKWLEESRKMYEEKDRREQKKFQILEEVEAIGHPIFRREEIIAAAV